MAAPSLELDVVPLPPQGPQPDIPRIYQLLRIIDHELALFENAPPVLPAIHQSWQQQQQQILQQQQQQQFQQQRQQFERVGQQLQQLREEFAAIGDRLNAIHARYGWIQFFHC